MPFLEVLTRCYKRPLMLAVNRTSLLAQTCNDWTQTLLIDDQGRGIGWSHENMAAYAPRLVGDFIWILDDDDMCILPDFVEGLRFIVADSDPDVIFVKMDHGGGRILPTRYWGMMPRCGEIGVSAFVVRRSVWQTHVSAMVPGMYTSDYALISSIWDGGASVYWWDVVASKVQKQSMGDAE
jgi:hypothetical protein